MEGTGMEHGYGKNAEDLVFLCRCAVTGEVPDPGRIAGMDLPAVFRTAKAHMLSAAAGAALESAGIRDASFTAALAAAQRRTAMLDADRARVLGALEQAGIWYMPLKGVVLKDLYPGFGMREMADNDILFDASRADDVKAAMENLGFTVKKFGRTNDDVYIREPVSSFEMHRSLFDGVLEEKLDNYYRDVRDRLVPDEGRRFGFHFSPDDFYVYMLAHAYKHYTRGGIGLRFLLDLFVFLQKETLRPEYVRQETEKLGIRAFGEDAARLAQNLFGGKAPAGGDLRMLRYILSSGTYGTVRNDADNRVSEKGKLRYFLSRLTIPYPIMLRDYPILKKAPVLYPAVWAWRFIYKFFTKHSTFMEEVRALFRKRRRSP